LAESGDKVTGSVLTKFVSQNSLPLIGEIGPHNYKKYVDRNLPLVWIFIDNDDEKQVSTVDLLKPIAKDASELLSFAKVDGKKWSKHAKSFGLESSTPGVVIEDRTSKKKFLYPLDDDKHKFDLSSLKQFIQSYRDGKLSAAIKSEELPEGTTAEDQLQSPLTTIVGKTYDKVVLDETKDVFVKFYAPWCGHCKAMVPTFEELGEKFKDDDNVIIGNFNASDNDSPLDIGGYPTLYYFPASKDGKKEPIQYKGERTADAMSEFILEHRKSKVGSPKTGLSSGSSPSGKEEL
jgi:protein disulfide-isomerase A1